MIKAHLVIAAELVNAAKAGDKKATADIKKRIYDELESQVLELADTMTQGIFKQFFEKFK